MSVTIGRNFRMTLKTKMFLWFYYLFNDASQWFITHCDFEEIKIECCLGCKVHHIPEFRLEEILGKCTCPCHTDPNWSPQLKRIKLKV